jgi:endonuclease/exonuclease/phosphatase family metal-dependent hydrolase
LQPVIDATAPDLHGVTQDWIIAALAATGDRAAHHRFAAQCQALQALEVAPPPRPAPVAKTFRVAAWNIERCKYAEPTLALVKQIGADVALVTEMDIGMARSGNRHTMRDLAGGLGAGYVFATEYVELGLGDDRERKWHAGQPNMSSLHGNGIIARQTLADPFVVRLDDGGVWFGESYKDQRRVGARNAVVARLTDAPRPLWFVSVHLESQSDPADRARQVTRMLTALKSRIGDAACVVGGDFNTNKLPRGDRMPDDVLANPRSIEPLFTVFADHGFAWATSNTPEQSCRTRPDGAPKPPFPRLDWLFVRGVTASSPRTVAAVDCKGAAISDHELIATDISF